MKSMKKTLRNIVVGGVMAGALTLNSGCYDIPIPPIGGYPRIPADADLSNATYAEPSKSNPNLRYVHVRVEKTGRRKTYVQVIPGKEKEDRLLQKKRREERHEWIEDKLIEALEYDAKESAKEGKPSLVDTTIVTTEATTEFFDTLIKSNTLHKKD